MATWPPIALFIDRGLEVAPFGDALSGEVECREQVDPAERGRVVALVTGSVPVTAADVAELPNLRLVLTCSTGTDHLDLEGLRALGLTVCNTPAHSSQEVADHALAGLLGAWRGLWRLGDAVRADGWELGAILRRFDAQRLGIIGLGRSGRALARSAAALGIQVVGHDPYLVEGVPGVRRLALDELLSVCDGVSLHMPGSAGAPPVLGAAELELIKPGAVLVNVSHASLVDLDAMIAALRSGRLAAAAWDVWEREPPAPGDARLLTPGLLVTPHVGWSSPQAQAACRAEAVQALRAVLVDGEEPPDRVA